jgi:hypothetical protein
MQTLQKYTLIVLLFTMAWSCSDSLDVDFDSVEQIASSNSLTVAVQDPSNPNSTGVYQLVVEGPKEFNSTHSTPLVQLKNLPAGDYLISVVSNGFVSYKKQVRISDPKGEGMDQRYRVEMPLVRRGADFRFSNATGGSVMFPEGSRVSAGAAFPAATGVSSYRNVRVDLQPCSFGDADCAGELALSASVIPMHADALSGRAVAPGKVGLFLLDFESAQTVRLTKAATVSFPLGFQSQALRQLNYSLVRVERDAATGLPRLTGESVPVAISADGSRGSANITDLSADWMFVADARFETVEAPRGFEQLARSPRPGKQVSSELSLNSTIESTFAQLLGLASPEMAISESIKVSPARNQNAEVLANYQVKKIRLTNTFTNLPVVDVNNLPNYPLIFQVIIAVPHSSGGHDSGGHDSGGG